MGAWDLYESRTSVRGKTPRETLLKRELRTLKDKFPDSLSYHEVLVDGKLCNIEIVNSDNFNEKTAFTLNKEIHHGSYISWMDNYWLVTELDVNNEVYTRAKIERCNYLLKWVDKAGILHEQWCIIADGTKYLTGEYEDRNFVVTRGDSRIAMIIARNEFTADFTRESRFLIDDPLSKSKLSYLLTKPLKVGAVYSDEGVYSFVLQEVVSTEDDNHELGIADYYKFFEKDTSDGTSINESPSVSDCENVEDGSGKKRWY